MADFAFQPYLAFYPPARLFAAYSRIQPAPIPRLLLQRPSTTCDQPVVRNFEAHRPASAHPHQPAAARPRARSRAIYELDGQRRRRSARRSRRGASATRNTRRSIRRQRRQTHAQDKSQEAGRARPPPPLGVHQAAAAAQVGRRRRSAPAALSSVWLVSSLLSLRWPILQRQKHTTTTVRTHKVVPFRSVHVMGTPTVPSQYNTKTFIHHTRHESAFYAHAPSTHMGNGGRGRTNTTEVIFYKT